MKLKITADGWHGYTGDFGGQNFTDGISDDDMLPYMAIRLSGIISCVDLATGLDVNIAAQMLEIQNTPMDENMPLPNTTGTTDDVPLVHGNEAAAYTKDELEAIASDKGIEGLRAIADPLAIEAKSIVKLIEAMIRAGVKKPLVITDPAPGAVGGDDTTYDHDKKAP